jgi:hypothetical protein
MSLQGSTSFPHKKKHYNGTNCRKYLRDRSYDSFCICKNLRAAIADKVI